jgi:hypothetical protein
VVTLTGVNIDADQLLLIVAPQVGRTLYNFASVTGTVSAGADTRVTLNASTAGLTTTSPLVIFYDDQGSTQAVAGTVTANVGGIASGVTVPVRLFAERQGSAPTGEDTLLQCNSSGSLNVALPSDGGTNAIQYDGTYSFVQVKQVSSVTIGSLPAISGTVTVGNSTTASAVAVRLIAEDTNPGGTGAGVNVNLYSNDNALLVDALKNGNSVLGYDGLSSYVQVKQAVGSSVTIGSLPAISGTVTANAILQNANAMAQAFIDESNAYGSVSVVLSGSAGDIGVAGTVTAAAPNGSLTTRFGTPTTANVSFATSAVTNASRKYLLIQNVTTGSNVITVGIGFTPTTTQGIQLTAGAGITFESSYIPTGAVRILSSVTASNFTILEA